MFIQNPNGVTLHGIMSSLRDLLDRESQIDPRIESANDGADAGEAVVQQEERRTGARVFVRSGAVGDDPLTFFEREIADVIFEILQGDGDGAGCMAFCIGLCASHVNKNGLT